MNEDTARRCSVLCPDGGSCSLQYSHTGEHYSTQELFLDMQNPDRHEVKRLRKEIATALAACAEMRAVLEGVLSEHEARVGECNCGICYPIHALLKKGGG